MQEQGAENAQDTNRQRQLQAALRTSGEKATWREHLVKLSEEGGWSGQEIAWILRTAYGIQVNQATACRWLKQAREETARMPDRETV